MFTNSASYTDDDRNDDNLNNTCDYLDLTIQFYYSSQGNFSIYDMNSRSLCRHLFDVQDFLATLDHSFSIYDFTETRLKMDYSGIMISGCVAVFVQEMCNDY